LSAAGDPRRLGSRPRGNKRQAEGVARRAWSRRLGTLTFTPKTDRDERGRRLQRHTGIIGLWADAVPTRSRRPAAGAALIGVDPSYA